MTIGMLENGMLFWNEGFLARYILFLMRTKKNALGKCLTNLIWGLYMDPHEREMTDQKVAKRTVTQEPAIHQGHNRVRKYQKPLYNQPASMPPSVCPRRSRKTTVGSPPHCPPSFPRSLPKWRMCLLHVSPCLPGSALGTSVPRAGSKNAERSRYHGKIGLSLPMCWVSGTSRLHKPKATPDVYRKYLVERMFHVVLWKYAVAQGMPIVPLRAFVYDGLCCHFLTWKKKKKSSVWFAKGESICLFAQIQRICSGMHIQNGLNLWCMFPQFWIECAA